MGESDCISSLSMVGLPYRLYSLILAQGTQRSTIVNLYDFFLSSE